MKQYILSLFLLCYTFVSQAQTPTEKYVPGEILLQLSQPGGMPKLLEELRTVNGKITGIQTLAELSDVMHIWHIRFNPAAVSNDEMLLAVKLNKHVREAQFNHYVELRATEPNDPQYGQQWQYDNDGSNGGVVDADIDAPEAWDITTGGTTADGDTIVVAIIDDGINLNHPDFGSNLWKNFAEIPGNGIDDDANGYIDDFNGWNSQGNNGTVTGGGHGTPVAGIVGANGDNNVGVAGVNWNVKLMIIRGSGGNEASVVGAYNYALKMRKRYNQSNGTQGAFVVATNSSFGINNGNPANFPLWCAMYDSMGVAGIVSAGATANANTNVDVAGDMPTACASNYLISVTNVGRNDQKITSAGYGANTIDMGSFGEATWTVTSTGYGAFGGTSGATPHVAGTAALMYSVPCPEFIQFAKADPAAAALQIKEWIMQSGDANASLAGITVSGKRLNTFNAVTEVLNNCGPCPLPGGVSASGITVSGANVSWNTNGTSTQYILQYRETGSGTWINTVVAAPPVILNSLNACTQYQYRLRSICGADSSTGYTNTFTFKTDGCCEPPLSSNVSGLTNSQAQIGWPAVTAATAYDFRYRVQGASAWINITGLTSPSQALNGLLTCTVYEYQIATVCTSGTTPYGVLYTFKTKGCGTCEEATYCNVSATSDYLYIDKVQLGPINNTSGNNGGYAGFVSGTYAILMADSASGITLTPAFPVVSLTANWNVWIDWNQNGVFEASEMAVNTSGAAAVTANITPPATADTGITRMRVAAAGLQAPSECGDAGFGEVEDYCVRIKPRPSAGVDEQTFSTGPMVYPNPASDVVQIYLSETGYNKIEVIDYSGKTIRTINVPDHTTWVQLSTENMAAGIYFVHLRGNKDTFIHKLVITK